MTPPRVRREVRLFIIYALIFLIALADALTPPGVVVAILLGIPILIASLFEEQRHVVAAGVTSIICFVLAIRFSPVPFDAQAIRLPNRVFALFGIVALSWIAVEFQRRRRQLERARADAESTRDLARLMHSLMAHDLRAPLVLARQGIEMVRNAAEAGTQPDLALLEEVDGRLGRSLRTIGLVLDTARDELDDRPRPEPSAPVPIAAELEEELTAFRPDAELRSKTLQLRVQPHDLVMRINPLVLRQTVAILVDNAIRYAAPDCITVLAESHGAVLWVHVRDRGPGLQATRGAGAHGAGIGLRLCRLLAARAGGSLEITRDGPDGTEFVLRLPARSP